MQGTLRKFVKQALSLVLEELQKVLNAENLKYFVTLLKYENSRKLFTKVTWFRVSSLVLSIAFHNKNLEGGRKKYFG